MSFFSIAIKNVRKKFGSYLIYFVSTLFAVTIFNLFCSIYYNPSFAAFRFGTGKMSVLFKGVAIAVLMFSAIFVIYSNDYFIKTKKKEIAIYSLLGMKNNQIASMMFIEALIIGLLATAFGTALGTFTSGYFTSILMKFMAAGTEVTLTVDIKAIAVTIIAFLILFIISGVRAYNTIYKYKLIELLSASKKGETLPEYSVKYGLISVALIAAGYFIAMTINVNVNGMKLLFPALCIVLLVTYGTYLFFRNFIPMLLVFIKHRKPVYYIISNFISISQISYRVKANAKMLCVISILCAITVTMISASYSLYHGLEDIVDFYAPYSYLCKNINTEQHEEILKTIKTTGDVNIVYEDNIPLIEAVMQDDIYKPYNNSEPGDEADCYILSESMYETIIKHTNTKKGSLSNNKTDFQGGLKDDECYFIDRYSNSEYCKSMSKSDLSINYQDGTTNFKVTGVSIHKYIGLIDNAERATVVLSDSAYNSYLSKAYDYDIEMFYGFVFDDEMASQSTVDAINEIVQVGDEIHRTISYIGFYKTNFAIYGSYVFIGLFIGVLFLLAVGSVLYYKLIIEAQEESQRYQILRKTGMNRWEITSSIAKQLGMVYGAPLLLGLCHTIFALFTYNRTLDIMGQETPTIQNSLIVVGIYVLIYGAFYLLSVWNYYRIVNK